MGIQLWERVGDAVTTGIDTLRRDKKRNLGQILATDSTRPQHTGIAGGLHALTLLPLSLGVLALTTADGVAAGEEVTHGTNNAAVSATSDADTTEQTSAGTVPALHIGIVALTLGTALTHIWLGAPLFVLNGVGYIVLATALVAPQFIPIAWVGNNPRAVRYLLMGYTGLTVVLWGVLSVPSTIGYINKINELALLGALALDDRRQRRLEQPATLAEAPAEPTEAPAEPTEAPAAEASA